VASQIVPRLADLGRYLASEATIYRILRSVGQLAHRSRSRPATVHRPGEHVATGPNQVFSWDITYLRAAVRGTFYYLYLVQDVFSRKIVGWAVHDRESAELAAELVEEVMIRLDIAPDRVVLHSDNGGPMKGATMLATLQRLGVVPSFSRPGVSDDNPYIEALFRTLKYRPEYPSGRFGSLEEARRWMALFVHWYNTRHLHSSLNFVTPADRHSGKEVEILENRKEVYAAAKRRNPERWTGATRNWAPEGDVVLNPAAEKRPEGERTKAA